MDQGSFINVLYGAFSADISFDADLPALVFSRYSVTIDLAYHHDAEAANPVGLWNSGPAVSWSDLRTNDFMVRWLFLEARRIIVHCREQLA